MTTKDVSIASRIETLRLPAHVENPDPSIYLTGKYGVLDLETTNYSGDPTPRDPRNYIVCWSFKTREALYYGTTRDLGLLKELVSECDFLVAHHAKFELQWLKSEGILDYGDKLVFDTMLAEYVLAGNRRVNLSLDETCNRYGCGRKHSFIHAALGCQFSCDDLPYSWLKEYNINDTLITEKLFLAQRKVLEERGQLGIVYTRCLVTPCLLDIESKGLSLDPERVRDTYDEYLKQFNDVVNQLKNDLGDINLDSPQQKAKALYDDLGIEELRDYKGDVVKTASGGRSTKKTTIERLVGKTERARRALKNLVLWSNLEAALGFLKKYKKFVDSDIRTFYAEFNQSVTANHRLSSTGVPPYDLNIQNQPREFKKLFQPKNPETQVYKEVDLVQFEFRVGINFSQDPQGIEDVKSGFDVHKFSAGHLEVSRQKAKSHTFKPVFGGSSGTPKERAYYKAFNERYSTLHRCQTGWVNQVLRHKKLRTPWGLEFYWPKCSKTRSGYVTYTNEIFNYPISSFACGEVSQIGLVYVWHLLRASKAKSYLVNTVHDSIIGEVFRDEGELFDALAVKGFGYYTLRYIKNVYNVDWTIPLGIEIKTGDHWGEGKEEKIELPPLVG